MHLRELKHKFTNSAMELDCPKCRNHRLTIKLMGNGKHGIYPFPHHDDPKVKAAEYTLDRPHQSKAPCGAHFEMKNGEVKVLKEAK